MAFPEPEDRPLTHQEQASMIHYAWTLMTDGDERNWTSAFDLLARVLAYSPKHMVCHGQPVEVAEIEGIDVEVTVERPGLSAEQVKRFFAGQRAFPISSLSEAQTWTWFMSLDRCEKGLLSWITEPRP